MGNMEPTPVDYSELRQMCDVCARFTPIRELQTVSQRFGSIMACAECAPKVGDRQIGSRGANSYPLGAEMTDQDLTFSEERKGAQYGNRPKE